MSPADGTSNASGSGSAMRSVVQRRYGDDPEAVLRVAEIARPVVGDQEVLVRVAAAGIDMGTWHCMTGMPYAMRLAGFGLRSPKAPNPGRALAGTVEAVGRGVTGFAPGDEVYGSCGGSFAEYAAVPVDQLAPKPWNLTFVQAAAVPISGPTALQALRKARVQPGHRVAVLGASGGVGSFAVQIAKAMGADVTGVCRTAKVGFVRGLGADRVVDHQTEDVVDGAPAYDAIIDTGGNRRVADLRRALAERGSLVIVGGDTGGRWLGGIDRPLRAVLRSAFTSQRLGMLTSTEDAGDLVVLGRMIEAGQLRPAVERTFPMVEVGSALRHLRAGQVRGKVVLTI